MFPAMNCRESLKIPIQTGSPRNVLIDPKGFCWYEFQALNRDSDDQKGIGMKKTSMLEKDLLALKEKLITAKEFVEVGDFFFDISRNNEFFKSGRKTKNSMLKGIIQAIAEQLTGKKDIVLTHFLLINIEKYKFWTRCIFCRGKTFGFFFILRK
ncbi:MAG: hypothetical protein HC887_08640 [Desulfobacteraceae bacterium]|nr:hypothetical protein [Desulfobacteraceae bacterium]